MLVAPVFDRATPPGPAPRTGKWLLFLISVLAWLAPSCTAQNSSPIVEDKGWKLVWSDEFDGPDGSPVDRSKWVVETGGEGWGNEELEYYTDRSANVFLRNGNLVVRALKEKYPLADPRARNYTSGRLKTFGKFSRAYGRFEARIKLPFGQGMWPAFWMLGDDIETAGWPGCGEIDVMENVGKEPSTIHGSIHGLGIPETWASRRRIRCPAGSAWQTTFIFSPWNGVTTRSIFMWTRQCTQSARALI